MLDILEKIKATLEIIFPFVLVVLAALGLSNIVLEAEKWYPIIVGGVGVIQTVLVIWVGALRARKNRLKL